MTDAKTIARGLKYSEARWVKSCGPDGARHGVYVADDLGKRGLCNQTGWPIKLTAKGKAVRRELERMGDGR